MKPGKRFVFLGGIPVYDYTVHLPMETLTRATDGKATVVGNRLLLPVGTVFRLRAADAEEPLYLNPLANVEVQQLQEESYAAMELGGKHPEEHPFTLVADRDTVLTELREAFPRTVAGPEDLRVVDVPRPVEIVLGGNNKNILEAIHALYSSPELAGEVEGVRFEHHFFADTASPRFRMVRELYDRLGVSLGPPEAMHVDGLLPRIGYVFNVTGADDEPMDRIILANRTNEEIIPLRRLNDRYFELEYRLRRDDDFVETHLVINSLTNQEEIRLLTRLLQTAYASRVTTYLCPTRTFLTGVDRLVESSYYTVEKERYFGYRRDFVHTALIPYLQYLILNRDELVLLDNVVTKKGIDATAALLAHRMNRGHQAEAYDGGRVVVTGGSQGARYTERLSRERATSFWQKADLPQTKPVRFAERRIVCGDDYVTGLTSTLGAGDLFSGIFVGLAALGWDGGHALRAATLGAQHFILHRTRPRIEDMVAMDEGHIRMGTETELSDVVSHHVDESGDPTRYGTISDTVITVSTAQIQHPFREVLALAGRGARDRTIPD